MKENLEAPKRDPILVNFRSDYAYDDGAKIGAALACPSQADFLRREKVRLALGHYAVKRITDHDAATGGTSQIIAEYNNINAAEAQRNVAFAFKRINERLAAGRIAYGFLAKAIDSNATPLPKGANSWNARDIIIALREPGPMEIKNFEHRIWRKSWPVIHIAAALHWLLLRAQEANNPVGLPGMLFDGQLVATLVRQANSYESIIEHDPLFPVNVNMLIPIRVLHDGSKIS